jgi:metal-sulfur cluster biosynthetic enzyme
MTVITKEQIINCLKDVYAPEIGINVIDLGLIYEI